MKNQAKGFSILEVMIAAGVLITIIVGASTFQKTIFQKTVSNSDRAFAVQKATQMFEELRAFVQSNKEDALKNLQDYYGNGVNQYIPTLTTEKKPNPVAPNDRRRDLHVNPDDPLSGNVLRTRNPDPAWKFTRQVLVDPVPSDPYARHVTVRIWYANENNEPRDRRVPLATVSGILKTNVNKSPPTQVYDVFMLALENMPGWWVDVASLRPIFDRTIDDLSSRNPGFEVRKHYITRLSYGRDPYYTPYINSANDTTTRIPWVYFYPGRITPTANGNGATESFVASNMQGRIRNDSNTQFYGIRKASDSVVSGAAYATRPYREYAFADQYNHGMRVEDERAMFERVRATSTETVEPSLRLLLEDINSNPDRYRNAMIINLHGELLPLPVVRNYSDPAKRPGTLPGVRVVAHPENIQYTNSSDTAAPNKGPVRMRVYGYRTVPWGSAGLPTYTPAMRDTENLRTTSMWVPWQPANVAPTSAELNAVTVQKYLGNDRVPYFLRPAPPSVPPLPPLALTAAYLEPATPDDDWTPPALPSLLAQRIGNDISGALLSRTPPSPATTNLSELCFNNTLILDDTARNAIRNRLRDQLIIINAGAPAGVTRVVRRVLEVENNVTCGGVAGRDRITVYGTISTADYGVGRYVVRHRDYDISNAPQTLYGTVRNGMLLRLYDTPLRTPLNTTDSNRGLPDGNRLVRQEYIPAPITNSFNNDLTFSSNNQAKNTARWVVSFDQANIARFRSGTVTFETRIGEDDGSPNLQHGLAQDGSTYEENNPSTAANENQTNLRPELYNVSRTYAYVGVNVPATEQFQFSGDPRHMPYLDVKLAHGYNPQFQGGLGGGYANYDRNNGTGFGAGLADVDFIRYSNLYVQGVMRSNSIYNSISGWSNYYFGLGGDMGADGENVIFNISEQPFVEAASTNTVSINSGIADVHHSTGNSRVVMSNHGGNNRWVGLHWLGELFPDEAFNFWHANGNLPTAGYTPAQGSPYVDTSRPETGTNTLAVSFWRTTYGTQPLNLDNDRRRNTNRSGCIAFMNGNTSGTGVANMFRHTSVGNNDTANLTSVAGSILNSSFNLSLSSQPKSNRPFNINDSSADAPPNYGQASVAGNIRNRLQLIDIQTGSLSGTVADNNTFYVQSPRISSSIIRISRNGQPSAGYMLVNGLNPAKDSGAITLSRFSQAGMLQAYMTGGDITGGIGDDTNRTRPIPRVEIIYPQPEDIQEDKTAVPVKFKASWLRWDNEKYSPSYPNSWYDVSELVFLGKYSADGGTTWQYLDGSTATKPLGEYEASKSLFGTPKQLDQVEDEYTVNWDIASLPRGTYLLRIEAYRQEPTGGLISLGYAYHNTYVSVRRTN